MGKLLFVLGLLLVLGAGTVWLQRLRAGGLSPAVPAVDSDAQARTTSQPPGPDRVANARTANEPTLRARCAAAGLPYPPRELFLRAFKHEAQLEVWARETQDAFQLLATYPVLASSGQAGPKRREGDRQVPEGFYEIDLWNPESNFHLSLRVNYPNAADRQLSDQQKPGGDIYLHGSNRSVGCLPLGDEAIEELYVLSVDVRDRGQARIPIHIFPTRMDGSDWEQFAAQHRGNDEGLSRFWEELRPGFVAFEKNRLVPQVIVDSEGHYRIGESPE